MSKNYNMDFELRKLYNVMLINTVLRYSNWDCYIQP